MKPFFSVIIPTLNEEQFLPKILTDLHKQKEQNFEVLIVDGKSHDKTVFEARRFSPYLPLQIIQSKRHVAYQRNYGAKKAKGDYLIFLDADSRISLSFTKRLTKIIKKNKGLLFIPSIVPDDKNTQTQLVFNFTNFLVEASQLFEKPFSTGGSLIMEKNTFHLIGGFPEEVFISEDHLLIQRAKRWGIKAKMLHDIKVVFSLRRLRREGDLRMFYKYISSTAYYILRGKVDKKIIEYEMGGHLYLKQKNKESFGDSIKRYLGEGKKFFTKFLYSLKEETIGK